MAIRTEVTNLWTVGRFIVINSIRTNSKDGNVRTNSKDGNGLTNSKDGNGGIILRLSDFVKALYFSSGTGYVDQILAVGLATDMN